MMKQEWDHKIFTIQEAGFEALALEIFRFQYEHSKVYRNYVQALGTDPAKVLAATTIPFLPIRFFKTHIVTATDPLPALVFESSGTTTTVNSRHFIQDAALYEESFTKGFEKFYGPAEDWCIIGLLPSYLERGNSSLVYMADRLIKKSGHAKSGFYLDEWERLAVLLKELEEKKQKTLLIGVTFALLDFAEQFPQPLAHTVIMETGGMKGRREEMIREEVHAKLQQAFGSLTIHSEYGMTELLSQAYSKGKGLFNCPPWMKIMLRDEEDPLTIKEEGSGVINVIDLANIYSCSFIATDDVGKLYADGSFEVLGRMDGSDLRGCSLMVF